jgi:hypothetical protein
MIPSHCQLGWEYDDPPIMCVVSRRTRTHAVKSLVNGINHRAVVVGRLAAAGGASLLGGGGGGGSRVHFVALVLASPEVQVRRWRGMSSRMHSLTPTAKLYNDRSSLSAYEPGLHSRTP